MPLVTVVAPSDHSWASRDSSRYTTSAPEPLETRMGPRHTWNWAPPWPETSRGAVEKVASPTSVVNRGRKTRPASMADMDDLLDPARRLASLILRGNSKKNKRRHQDVQRGDASCC